MAAGVVVIVATLVGATWWATDAATAQALFAATNLLLAGDDPQSFFQPLDHTGALYFAVTVLATVG